MEDREMSMMTEIKPEFVRQLLATAHSKAQGKGQQAPAKPIDEVRLRFGRSERST